MAGQSSHRSRAAEMAVMYEHKRTVTESVRKYIAAYGDDIVAIVMAFALQPKRMPILFTKLDLKYTHDPETQLRHLKTYLAQRGRFEFLKRINSDPKKKVDAANIDDICKGMEEGEDLVLEQAPPVTTEQIIKTADYQGENRRVIPDRRKNEDRRNDIAAITKNKRFGGDRRRNKRRRTD